MATDVSVDDPRVYGIDTTSIRRVALNLAIETVRTAQNFSSHDIVHTAKLYEQYLLDGTVPERPAVSQDSSGVVDA